MSTKGKVRINLKEDQQKAVVKLYEDSLIKAEKKTKEIVDKMIALAEKEEYKVITDLTNSIINFYGQDLRDIMLGNYQEWEAGEGSLHRQIEGALAGEEAVATAKKIERSLENGIEQMFARAQQEISVPSSNPNIEPEKLEKMAEALNKYCKEIEEIGKTQVNKIDKKSVENQLFEGIRPHIVATFSGIEAGFQERVAKTKGVSEELLAIVNQGIQRMKDSSEELKQKSSNSSKEVTGSNFPNLQFF